MGHGELPSTSTQMNLTTRPHPPLWVSQNDFFLNTARTHVHRQQSCTPRLKSEWCPELTVLPPAGCWAWWPSLQLFHVTSHLVTLVVFQNLGESFPFPLQCISSVLVQ